MKRWLIQLWRDQRAAIAASELILIATIVGIGVIVGLTIYRDAIVQELGDSAAAMAALNQGYSYDSISVVGGSFGFLTYDFEQFGSNYTDEPDFCQPTPLDPDGAAPMCISVAAGAISEGTPVGPPTGI